MISFDTLLYFLAVIAFLFAVIAEVKVKTTFNKYSRIGVGMTGREVAERILRSEGIYNVRIERVGGHLSDHYDPRTNTLRLSDSVYNSSSAAAVGVAAHEVGHAIQHAVGYTPIKLRMALVPAATFASKLTWVLIFAGFLVSMLLESALGYYVTVFGIGLFAVVTLFELVTLPCELNASRRAMKALRATGGFSASSLAASRKVLTAAALTYVASLAISLIQLLRLIVRANNQRR